MTKFLHIYSVVLHAYIYKKLPFKKRKIQNKRKTVKKKKKKGIPKIKDFKIKVGKILKSRS